MCLGVPGRIVAVDREDERLARVDFGGAASDVRLDFVPEAGIGDYVIVHAGFALTRLDEEAARRTLELLREVAGEAPP
ncbi:MAG: HypC/HybG/HupF family hydrogenase formation chaperone [Acidobacteria bacterium]|nr:MAG: HypC/HybG/HupF family hydrogenase formation chaperone [Acidobacteriota bacterium]